MKYWNYAVLGLILACYCALHFAALPLNYLWSDEALYAGYVGMLGENPANIFSPALWEWHPPLFPLVSSLFLFFLPPLDAARFASFLFGAFALVLTYLIGRRIGGDIAGLSSAFLLAFSAYFFVFSGFGLLDVPLSAFVLLVAYSAIRYADSGKWGLFAFSLAASLFVKWPAVALIPFSFFYILYLDFRRLKGGDLRRAAVRHSAIFAALFLATFLFFTSHFFAESPNGYLGLDIPAQASGFFSGLTGLVGLPLLPFLALGLVAALRRRTDADMAVLLSILVFLPLIFFNYVITRYLLPILPLAMILAGCLISEVKVTLSGFKFRNVFITLFLVLLALPGFFSIMQYMLSKPGNVSAYGDVASWLLENADKNAVIFAYADREFNFFMKVAATPPYGGRILMLPESRAGFENALREINSQAIVVVDNNKRPFFLGRKPGWLYRLPDYRAYLEGAGFSRIKYFVLSGGDINGRFEFEIYSFSPPDKKPASAP